MRNNFEKLYEYEFNLRKIAEQECFRNKALADKRLVMLKSTEKKMVFCLECDGRLTNFGKAEELKGMGYEVGHTDDCELAEAIDG